MYSKSLCRLFFVMIQLLIHFKSPVSMSWGPVWLFSLNWEQLSRNSASAKSWNESLRRVFKSLVHYLSFAPKNKHFFLLFSVLFVILWYIKGKTMRHEIPSIMEVKHCTLSRKTLQIDTAPLVWYTKSWQTHKKTRVMKIFDVCHIRCVKN